MVCSPRHCLILLKHWLLIQSLEKGTSAIPSLVAKQLTQQSVSVRSTAVRRAEICYQHQWIIFTLSAIYLCADTKAGSLFWGPGSFLFSGTYCSIAALLSSFAHNCLNSVYIFLVADNNMSREIVHCFFLTVCLHIFLALNILLLSLSIYSLFKGKFASSKAPEKQTVLPQLPEDLSKEYEFLIILDMKCENVHFIWNINSEFL